MLHALLFYYIDIFKKVLNSIKYMYCFMKTIKLHVPISEDIFF